MVLRVAIVGPGRVGRAFGYRLAAAGVHLLGFVARSAGSAAAAVDAVGAGRELTWTELRTAHVVIFSVGDGDLPTAIAAAAQAAGARPCSLWLHTSGRCDLAVFDGVPGIRRGALHPVLPFAAADVSANKLHGAPAVLQGDARSRRLLHRLAVRLGMHAIWRDAGDPVLYHAACALAANGLTALFAAAQQVLQAAGGLVPDDRQRIVATLMRAALAHCEERGPARALSGPVRRGDAAAVEAHMQALTAFAPAGDFAALYRALMERALALALEAGLAAELAPPVRRALHCKPAQA